MSDNDSRFRTAVDWVIEIEGGFSDHPHDAGGKTIYGIASASWPGWYDHIMEAYRRGNSDQALDRARQFYHDEVWGARRFDRIESLNLCVLAFDLHVNHSMRAAGRIVQRALNQLIHGLRYEPLLEDGWMGNLTVTRMNALSRRYEEAVIGAIIGERWRYYRAVAAARPQNRSFMRGWAKRVLPYRSS